MKKKLFNLVSEMKKKKNGKKSLKNI